MTRLVSEPLVHFLLLGAVLFAAYSLLSTREDAPPDAIVVSAGKIEHLAALFARTWQRQPTRNELGGLINDFIREEVAYREGMTVGLDRDDTIIRRRIRQKLEFVAEDLASQVEPSGDELDAYLAAHRDDFRVDPCLTFRQVFFNPEQRGESVAIDARDQLIALKGDPSVEASMLGDRILLNHAYVDASMREIANLFGHQFAAAVIELKPDVWQGPIESGYGVHLVFVDERSESRLPELAEIRGQVRREWDNAQRLAAIDLFYSNMLEKYEVIIELPEPEGQGDTP